MESILVSLKQDAELYRALMDELYVANKTGTSNIQAIALLSKINKLGESLLERIKIINSNWNIQDIKKLEELLKPISDVNIDACTK